MKKYSLKSQLALSVSALMIAGSFSTASFAQTDGAAVEDEVISTGTRRKARSASDTPAPVDVISGVEFQNNASSDIGDLLRTVVPSYNVNTQPISDASTIIRPANLRGLSPDNTLVLLNGKRRHRGSVIAFLGGGISDGAQGVDIGVFPAIGLKQVEVLRDGASSQYGSDAIAGVMNFVLKDASEGGMVEVKYGSTYAGDGDNYRISGNVGLPLGPNGFANISAEYGASDGTLRAVQRGDAAGLIAAGNTAVGDISVNTQTTDFVQYWGNPDVKDDIKLFVNTGIELTENVEAYAFGNYAERNVEGGFFYRNPTNRGGVFRGPQFDGTNSSLGDDNIVTSNDNGTPDDDSDDFFENSFGVVAEADIVDSVRVGTLAGGTAACPRGIPLTSGGGLIPDPTVLASVSANANCFSFLETFPGGFVPRFGGDNRDIAFTAGLRGELDVGNGLGYDISGSYGSNKTDFFISNTINASLGPNTPTSFVPGAYEQIETAFNLDLNYGVPIDGWASDLNIAAGFEWHDEQFDITAGDPASFALGPLAAPFDPADPNNQNGVAGFPTGQGFSSSSNGFGGFAQSSSNSQGNIAIYGELEADVTDAFTLQAALRWEDYDLFGTTTNWKIGALYKLTDSMRLRGTYSTGFHAPSAGQANVVNTTTAFNTAGELADQGTIPLNSAPGDLAADFLEASGPRPSLGPETADNLSIGIAFDTGPMSWTVDYFNISVKDRIALTDNFDFQEVLDFTGTGLATYDGSSIGAALTTLDAGGRLNRADFAGFEDLRFFRFFTNNFDTKTTGFDIVGRMPFDVGVGSSSVAIAANYTDTTVKNSGQIVPLSDVRISALEDQLPKWKGNIMLNHEQGMWRGLARVTYHSSYVNTNNGASNAGVFTPGETVGSELLVDLELGAKVMENVEIIVGGSNVFDSYPDENPGQLGIGQLYPELAPFGFNGGSYYVKARVTF